MSSIFTKLLLLQQQQGRWIILFACYLFFLFFSLLKRDPGQRGSDGPPCSHPARRLHPSTRWCTHTSRRSCYRLLRSGTGSAADSRLRKTPQGILGQKKKESMFFTHQSPVCEQFYMCVCVFSPTFCAAGSGPAWRARALSAGRVADAVVTAAAGLVTPLPVGTGGACCQRGATIPLPLRELC